MDGNLGRPPEEVGRRKKGAERAKAWKLAQGPERCGCGGLARRGWQSVVVGWGVTKGCPQEPRQRKGESALISLTPLMSS